MALFDFSVHAAIGTLAYARLQSHLMKMKWSIVR